MIDKIKEMSDKDFINDFIDKVVNNQIKLDYDNKETKYLSELVIELATIIYKAKDFLESEVGIYINPFTKLYAAGDELTKTGLGYLYSILSSDKDAEDRY